VKNRHDAVRPTCGAFSLLELLIVVAVIGLLLAISLPALRACKALAGRVVCRSNLQQLYLAWDAYLLHNNDLFYQAKNANLNYGGWKGQTGESPRPLNPYVELPPDMDAPEGAEIFLCPADKGGAPGYAFDLKVFLYMGTSYHANPLLIGLGKIPVPDNQYKVLHEAINRHIERLSRASVDNPWRVLLMGDYCWGNQWQPGAFPTKDWHGKAEHFNMAFLDGHTDFVHVRKGIYVNGNYTVLPVKNLYPLAEEAQRANQP
jgi:prepilin-type N-terminal cleavage/methylation domain-containing protein/prepilin-type processing-associated H-X9-DG protein